MNSQILFLHSELVIRPAGEHDAGAIERLTQLEGRRLDGRMLVAEVGGEIRAAVSIGSGAVLADPFRRTAELVELLERSRAHRDGATRERGSAFGRFGAAVRERLRPPRRPASNAPTVLGDETTLIR
jgi:hypothetical protein